jgi:pSer/pThr/pTyr-binding forkhead associated (FHA) protein
MTQPYGLVFVEEEPVTGRVVPVTPGAVIGRSSCDVVLPDPEVSRKHAVVRDGVDGPTIQDLGSLNGTFVNGRRIEEPTVLKAGDTVRFGNTIWHVDRGEDG